MGFIEISRDDIPPVIYVSVEIDKNGSTFVEQLWGVVGEVIYYTSRLIEPMFNTFGVTAEEQSPFCRIFSSPTDLQEEFIAYLPITFYFGDASGTAEPSNTKYEACDAPTTSPEAIVLEQFRMFS